MEAGIANQVWTIGEPLNQSQMLKHFLFISCFSDKLSFRMDKFIRILLWMVCTVLFGLSPLVLRFLNSRTDEQPMSVSDTLKAGDLFIVGAVVAADAIGKALGATHAVPAIKDKIYHAKRLTRVICGCACLALLCIASGEFSQISGRIDSKTMYNASNVVHDSVVVFACIVAAGLGVMMVVEE
jgi:hypothetical protein